MCFDTGVRIALVRYDKALRAVFTSYSETFTKDGKSTEDDFGNDEKFEKRATLDASWAGSRAASIIRLMPISRFEAVLRDASLIRGPMTGTVLRMIHSGLQSCMAEESSDSEGELEDIEEEGSEDSERSAVTNSGGPTLSDGKLSFPEFTDALVAVTLYLDPNPFEKFAMRFERFIRDKFLMALRVYWSEVHPDAGLGTILDGLLETKGPKISPSKDKSKSGTPRSKHKG